MRFYRRNSSLLLAVAAWAALLANDSFATVMVDTTTTTEWVGAPENPGSWFDSSNWSDGVPDINDVAEISNGGEVDFRRGRGEAFILRLKQGSYSPQVLSSELVIASHPVSHVRQSGGRLRIPYGLLIDDGRYDLERGRLLTGAIQLGEPRGVFLAPWLNIPIEITLPLDPPPLSAIEQVDPIKFPIFSSSRVPVQQFRQSGGRTNIDRRLSIYSGGVQVSGGRLRADSILIDISLFQLASELSGMEQAGGIVRVTDELLIQNNSYKLSGGLLQVDRIAIGDPALEAGSATLLNRLPEFIQTGGLNIVTGDLDLCVPWFNIDSLRPFQAANYRLEGGALRVGGDTIVGSLGAAPVNFLQSAGRADIGGTLRIEGDSSRYELSGGRLSTENLEIGMGVFNTGGTFAITEPTSARGRLPFFRSEQVTVRNRISLGEESVFEAVPGSRMRLAGGKFENFSTNDENLAGLNNLELIIGDTIWNPFQASTAQVTELEVGGLDLGDVDEGYVENFALDTLRIGGLNPAHLKLVDLVDNQLDFDSPEALYVDHLVVGRGSTLDLDGIFIYYRTARILGNVINTVQTLVSTSQVPEPASALLLLVGSVFFTRARRAHGLQLMGFRRVI